MLQVRRFRTASVSPARLQELHQLLFDVFVDDFTDDDWDHALGGWHVVIEDGDMVIAHAAVGARLLEVDGRPVHVGYVEGVAVARVRQSEGIGSLLMDDVNELIRADFEMGGLSTSSHPFYERLGWERWRGPTFVRHGGETIRSEDEDDGVMVLRFGPSQTVDLTAPISCESRSGDDW